MICTKKISLGLYQEIKSAIIPDQLAPVKRLNKKVYQLENNSGGTHRYLDLKLPELTKFTFSVSLRNGPDKITNIGLSTLATSTKLSTLKLGYVTFF